MSEKNHEPKQPLPELSFSDAEAIELLRQRGACLPIIEGDLSNGKGRKLTVQLHGIPMTDLLDHDKFVGHFEAVRAADDADIYVDITGLKMGFDADDASFRISHRNQIDLSVNEDQTTPARLVILDTSNHVFSFLTLD